MKFPDDLKYVLSNEYDLRKAVNDWKVVADGPQELMDNTSVLTKVSTYRASEVTRAEDKIIVIFDKIKTGILTPLYRVMRLLKKRGII